MKVILKNHVAKIGQKYEVVNVSDGHALNFLIPRGLAEVATPEALRRIEKVQARVQSENEARHKDIVALLENLNGKKFTLTRQTNEQGHLFAKIGVADISKAISDAQGVTVPEEMIELSNSIKEVGEHEVVLKNNGDRATVIISVEAE